MIDGFLKLLDENGAVVNGESEDAEQDYRDLIAIKDFSLGDGTASSDEDEDPETKSLLRQVKATHQVSSARAAGNKAMSRPEDRRLADLLEKTEASANKSKGKAEGGVGGEQLTFSVTKEVDSASPDLFLAWCRMNVHKEPQSEKDKKIGHFQKAIVTIRKKFGEEAAPYLTCTFEDVRLTSYKLDYDDNGATMKESIDFKFTGYRVEYIPQTMSGTKAQGQMKWAEGKVSGNTQAGAS